MGLDWVVWGVIIAVVGSVIVVGWLGYMIVRNATKGRSDH